MPWIILLIIAAIILFAKKGNKADSKKVKADTGRNSDYGLSKMKKEISRQDAVLAELNKAKSYEIDEKIKAYETLIPKGPKRLSFSYHYDLVDMYLKTKQYNKAWAYTNKLYLSTMKNQIDMDNLPKIRHLQFDILRNEKNTKKPWKCFYVNML